MKLLAIDGNSIMNRAYYGVKPLSTKDGIYTHAILGFINIYNKVKADFSPDCCAVAFDLREPTFRHKAVESYKANRHGMDDELAMQMPYIKEILKYMGISILEVSGYEADDILGTLAAMTSEEDKCCILTGDRDSLQLVRNNVTVKLHTTRELIDFTPERFMMEYDGLQPLQLIDLKALMGDSSDNISGVKGIGQKTAMGLIKNFGSIDSVYKNIDEGVSVGTKSVIAKLKEGRESAYQSRWLAEIVTDVPIEKGFAAYVYKPQESELLAEVLSKLEMTKLIEKMKLRVPKRSKRSVAPPVEFTEASEPPKGDFTFLLTDNGVLYTAENGRVYKCSGDKAAIAQLLSSDSKKYTYDAKKAYHFCISQGTQLKNVVSDAMIAAYLLDTNEKEYTIKQLCADYSCNDYENMGELASVCTLSELCSILDDKIREENLDRIYREIELPLTEVLASMEENGILVDSKGIKEFGDSLKDDISELEQRIYFHAGHEFNISSPKQLSVVLYEEMGLPSGRRTKSGYSTNADALAELVDKHPIAADILQYRQLTKLMSTYVEGLSKMVGKDGRIHTVFKQTETRTGRISSTEPNLQNIPVRTELGRNMRKFFIAPKGKKLVDADYSQIELRILAHLSDDKNMKANFAGGEDIHTATAAQVFGMPVSMVTPEMRRAAKAVNFGIVYGISAFSLSKDIDVSTKDAQKYIDNYLNNYSGVRRFMAEAVKTATEKGYSETLFGRKRYIPELKASKNTIVQLGRRMAMNAPVQGTAADIIKLAMIKVYQRLKNELPNARLMLQIHDELIIEADYCDVEKAAQILAEEMPAAADLSVELVTDIRSGDSWFDTH